MVGEVVFGIGYVALCILMGYITRGKPILGINKTLGFWFGFYASFFFTPLLVFFVFLCIPDRRAKKKRNRAGA